MESASLATKATRGAMWSLIDRIGSMGLLFIVNLIMARMLMPEDFGIVGMLAIFICVLQTFLDGGFATALIQKKNILQTDYSTIFIWNVFFSMCLYGILYYSAPFISLYYKMELLTPVVRVIGLSLIPLGMASVQKARLQRLLAFRTLASVNISSYSIASVCAIMMAYYGFGVWSLVCLQVGNSICVVLMLYIITRWHPDKIFSVRAFKELFGFGGYIFAANLLQTICQNLQGLIIGKRYSAVQMGYYSQAYKLDQATSYVFPQILVQVIYPIFSSVQDNLDKLRGIIGMSVRVITFLIFPLEALLILSADPLIPLLYGAKWLQSVPYFRVLCVGGLFMCLQNINFYAVAAVGKSGVLFLWSFYKWGFLIAALLIGMYFGMTGILWGMVISSANIFFVNSLLAQHYIRYSLLNQLRDIMPAFLIVVCSALVVLAVSFVTRSFIVLVCVFVVSYIVLSWLFRIRALGETLYFMGKLIRG